MGTAAAACAGLALVAGSSTSAAAHPFGPPSTASVSASGSQVEVRWTAPDDDLLILGHVTGAFDDPSVTVPEPGDAASDIPQDAAVDRTGERRLTGSPAVASYLAERIAVEQDGVPCRGGEPSLEELTGRGAQVTFACPAPVEVVEVEIAVLTDVHEAYRTVVSGAGRSGRDRALLTATEPRTVWRFDGSATGDDGSSVTWVALAGSLVVLGLAVRTVRAARVPPVDAR